MLEFDRLNAAVHELLVHVGRTELLARLPDAASTVREKSPGELVTAADVAAEAALRNALTDLTPSALVVGEEAAHADPRLLDHLERPAVAWVVDPIDGTRHFAAGTGPFGIMLALLQHGRCEAAWIHLPLESVTAHARRGHGAFWNGAPIQIPVVGDGPLRAGMLTRFMSPAMRARADALPEFLETGSGTTDAGQPVLRRTDGEHHCAAQRYLDLLRGREHAAAYWRTLPWDHLPGVLLVQEAGGHAARFDGSPLEPADVRGEGLLVAANTSLWEQFARALGTE